MLLKEFVRCQVEGGGMGFLDILIGIGVGLKTLSEITSALSKENQQNEYIPDEQQLFIRILSFVAQSDGMLNLKEQNSFKQLWKDRYENDVSKENISEFLKERNTNLAFENFLYLIEKSNIPEQHSPVDILDMVESAFTLAIVDTPLNRSEIVCLERISRMLNISDNKIFKMEEEFNQYQTNQKSNYRKSYSESNGTGDSFENFEQDKYKDPFDILGLKKTATLEEINAAYRSLSKQFHPDIISSKNLNEDFIKYAEKRFIEIDRAYRSLKSGSAQ